MKSEYLNLTIDLVELLHNPNLSKRNYMLRIKNDIYQKYETVLKRDELKDLADFIYKFLYETNDNNYLELFEGDGYEHCD
jgi:hypothetical protein